MRKSHADTKEDINRIIDLMNQPNGTSCDELCSKVGMKRQSIYKYIKEIENMGYVIDKPSKKNLNKYHIISNDAEMLQYTSIDYDILRKNVILEIIKSSDRIKDSKLLKLILFCPEKRKQKNEEIALPKNNQGEDSTSTIHEENDEEKIIQYPLDVGVVTYYKLLNSLIKNKYIKKDKKYAYYSLADNNTVIFHKITSNDIDNLIAKLENISEGTLAHDHVSGLLSRLAPYVEYFDDNNSSKPSIFLRNGLNRKKYAESIETLSKLLIHDNYRKKRLKIEYVIDSNRTTELLFSLGIIVYYMEEDSFYLYGKAQGVEIILNMSKIKAIEITEDDNKIKYQRYIDSLAANVGISSPQSSSSKKIEVEIHFDNRPDIKRRLNAYKNNRPSADITYDTDITLKDIIPDSPNFERFLRSFATGVKSISPPEIKNRILESARKQLLQYEELNK
ncbi:WYL domain-containing transcriptional regulator [Butyrivibrio sp. YAB3001]|uniref:WYL domain-containing transcriptional regulator n=1 Tax=Butyrivibrio sp. YAB3001 TaxID=1520812 RepID=UPI0008F67383|nr:WYL domain-containing transcriptional regulator [Butyrivibrio sp. YAB3001]SFD03019.1 HTH domain-containing protein [Butyrivibrio sp. YAB3001]